METAACKRKKTVKKDNQNMKMNMKIWNKIMEPIMPTHVPIVQKFVMSKKIRQSHLRRDK